MNRSNYEYKKSGVLWFGDIPDHWEIKKVKHIARFYTGWTPPSGNDEYYDGEYPWANISDLGTKYLETPVRKITQEAIDTLRMSISKKGSLLFSFKLSIGLVSMLSKDLFTNEAIATFPPNNRIETTYLYYLAPVAIPMNAGINIYNAPMLNQDSIKNAVLVYPPLDEQQAVASFLDRETARIDALIQKKERMIELLKEKRIALITQSVTKGLDPNVPMKTSGIKWLGEVPEHWSVKRLKYLSSCNDESLPESTDPDFEMLYVDISSVTRIEGITNKEEMRFEDAPSRARRRVRDGDTIVSTVRTYLRAIAPIENAEDNLIVSTGFAVLRPVNICSDYLSLIIQSHYVVESIVVRSVGVSYPAINASDIGDIRITIPPTSEQHDIVDKVRKAILQIDTLQSKNEHSITLLREYRSSLIHHAVTGKIDLRGHDAQAQ